MSKKHSTCNKYNLNSVVAPPNCKSALFLTGMRSSAAPINVSNQTGTKFKQDPYLWAYSKNKTSVS